jgi:hypothetical protein
MRILFYPDVCTIQDKMDKFCEERHENKKSMEMTREENGTRKHDVPTLSRIREWFQ